MTSNVGVSVHCPGWHNTRIDDSARNVPAGLQLSAPTALSQAMMEEVRKLLRTGLDPSHVAERVIAGIENGTLHILTHPELMVMIEERFRQILNSRP